MTNQDFTTSDDAIHDPIMLRVLQLHVTEADVPEASLMLYSVVWLPTL